MTALAAGTNTSNDKIAEIDNLRVRVDLRTAWKTISREHSLHSFMNLRAALGTDAAGVAGKIVSASKAFEPSDQLDRGEVRTQPIPQAGPTKQQCEQTQERKIEISRPHMLLGSRKNDNENDSEQASSFDQVKNECPRPSLPNGCSAFLASPRAPWELAVSILSRHPHRTGWAGESPLKELCFEMQHHYGLTTIAFYQTHVKTHLAGWWTAASEKFHIAPPRIRERGERSARRSGASLRFAGGVDRRTLLGQSP